MRRQTNWGMGQQQHRDAIDARTPPPRRVAPPPPPPPLQSVDSSPFVAMSLSSPLSLKHRIDSFDESPSDCLRAPHAKDFSVHKNRGHCDNEMDWRHELLRRERDLEEREEEFHTLLRMQHAAYTKRLQEISRKEKFLMEWEQRLRSAESISQRGGERDRERGNGGQNAVNEYMGDAVKPWGV